MIRYRLRDDVLWRRNLDRVLAIRPGDPAVTVVAGGGSAVWDLLHRPVSVSELTAALALTHEPPPDVLGREVRALVEDLLERGMVEVAG